MNKEKDVWEELYSIMFPVEIFKIGKKQVVDYDFYKNTRGMLYKQIRYFISKNFHPKSESVLKEEVSEELEEGTWKGKRIKDMSRKEILEALEETNKLYLSALDIK